MIKYINILYMHTYLNKPKWWRNSSNDTYLLKWGKRENEKNKSDVIVKYTSQFGSHELIMLNRV